MSGAEQAVTRTLHEYVAACNAGDVEAYKATLASDVVFEPPDQSAVRGRDNVGAWVKDGFFDAFEVSFDARFDRILVVGSEAFTPGTFTLGLKPRSGGEPISTTGAFFNVFREESPGSWKYAYAIFNFDKPLA